MMINRLSEYCDNWGLTVNLDKSKILIFKNGGRRAKDERWWFRRQEIEVVKEYSYLGFKITSNLNFERHILNKVSEGKAALAVTWKKIMDNPNIATTRKQQIFQSTSVATALYADSCWGFNRSNTLEGLQRRFIKRIFKLPLATPNYMITLETGLPDMFLTTLKHNFGYVTKLLTSNNSKLSKRVALYVIDRKLAWCRTWFDIAADVDFTFNLNILTPNLWEAQFDKLLNKLHMESISKCYEDAKNSTARVIYPALQIIPLENSFFDTKYSNDMISTIFKIRGELTNLNYIPHRNDLPIFCQLCELRQPETVIHFLGICPALQELRLSHFDFPFLMVDEICNILNGRNWYTLYSYCKEALKYRST
jgi:hypothetical protein